MPRTNKMGSPKHLEKMLFINHKEDIMLDDKLHDLKLRSRYKVMELDRERIKVRTELRNSRKKNITLSEAITGGLLPKPEVHSEENSGTTIFEPSSLQGQNTKSGLGLSGKYANRDADSARVYKKLDRPSFSRSTSFAEGINNGRKGAPTTHRLSIHPLINETHERRVSNISGQSRRYSADTVGEYVLGEFEKMSQVVPDILRALAKKKEKQQEIDDQLSHVTTVPNPDDINVMEYEPDMNKVRKTVMSVKTLRHRMAISKRLNSVKPQKSLEQMIKDKIDNAGENDEFTDGTCALMKRRLEKKRRGSGSECSDGQLVPRRHSMFASLPDSLGTRANTDRKPFSANTGQLRNRSASIVQFPTILSRQTTSLGFGSPAKMGSLGFMLDLIDGAQVIDEDLLRNRQRVLRELDKYQLIQERIDKFLIGPSTNIPVF